MVNRKCNTLEGNAIMEHVLLELRRQEFLNHWNLNVARGRQSLTKLYPQRDIVPSDQWMLVDCSDLKRQTGWQVSLSSPESRDVALNIIFDPFAKRSSYIIEAIREFLDIDSQVDYNLSYSAFISDRRSGRRYWTPHGIDHPQGVGFIDYRELAHHKWCIEVEVIEWMFVSTQRPKSCKCHRCIQTSVLLHMELVLPHSHLLNAQSRV
jgi:hypothetical protein